MSNLRSDGLAELIWLQIKYKNLFNIIIGKYDTIVKLIHQNQMYNIHYNN